MGNRKLLTKRVIENFDFDRVLEVMGFLDWKWVGSKNGVPSKKELIKTAKYCLKSAYKQAKEHANPDIPYICSTGGFKASAIYGDNNKVDFLELEFIISQWEETIG